MKDKFSSDAESQYDAIIIGSGLGGLTTAAILTKLNKKRVLVLERHYEAGGLTHEFKRGAYSWDVGLHYMGDIKKRLFDFIGWNIFKYISNGKLKWNKIPDPFDKICIPGMTLNINSSAKAYKNELIRHFPHQKRAINKYVSDIHKIRLWCIFDFFSRVFYPPMSWVFKLLSQINKKMALMKTIDYLNKYIPDKKLQSVLISRWGNYGIPPLESAFAIHAVIEHHYYSGGLFPDGGAEKIFNAIEETIEENGGKILINREVTEIILNQDRTKAIGVRVKNISNPANRITDYYAPIIVSNAGVLNTYCKLLPSDLNLSIQKKLVDFHQGYSGINIYLGLNASPETLGIKCENYWINDNYNINCNKKLKNNKFSETVDYCFLSFPSQKSNKSGANTADIVAMMPYSIFKKWEDSFWKERSNEYYELKDKIIESYLKLVDKYIPGFSRLVVYKEMASPLTFKHFTNRMGGAFYGLPGIPDRYKIKEIRVKTPIKGLFLTGTDILSNGILPALITGMATASYINGSNGILKVIFSALFYKPQKNIKMQKKSFKTSEDKMVGLLVKKINKTKNLIELTYRFDEMLNFIPGQHVKIQVGESDWRAYSIAKSDEHNLTIIVDTRPGGQGANYIKNIKLHQETLFRMPLTDLIYHNTTRNIMFIATGTGLVPFLHILDELKSKKIKNKITVLFGCMTENDNFIDSYLQQYEKYFFIEKIICVEKPGLKSKNIKGRVTDYLKKSKLNFKKIDFYVCGHPHMMQEAISILRKKGADRIYW